MLKFHPFFNSLVPNTSLDPYYCIFQKGYVRTMLNILFVSIASFLSGLIINSMATSAFSQFCFKGDYLFFEFMILSFTVPADAITIPLF